MEYGWIILIVAIAALIKGITGFGFALVAMPPLLFWYSPKELVPALMLCNWVVSVIIVMQKKERNLVSKPFRHLIVWGAVFTLAGVAALKYVPEQTLIMGMAIVFIVLLIFTLSGRRLPLKLSQPAYNITGAICGFLEGCISVSGPLLVLFLHHAKTGNREFREIFSWFSIVTATIALIGYLSIGLLTLKTLEMTALVLPILYAGSYAGKRINQQLPPLLFKRMSIVLTLISCVVLLMKLK